MTVHSVPAAGTWAPRFRLSKGDRIDIRHGSQTNTTMSIREEIAARVRDRRVIGALALAVLLLGAYAFRGGEPRTVTLSGTIEADEIRVGFAPGGRVARVGRPRRAHGGAGCVLLRASAASRIDPIPGLRAN